MAATLAPAAPQRVGAASTHRQSANPSFLFPKRRQDPSSVRQDLSYRHNHNTPNPGLPTMREARLMYKLASQRSIL